MDDLRVPHGTPMTQETTKSAQPHTPKPFEVCPSEEDAHTVAFGDEIVQQFDAHGLQLHMILSNTSLDAKKGTGPRGTWKMAMENGFTYRFNEYVYIYR